jgi:16S rRNA (adenine1518-N6/adenine1519-N6)-dimethyltransferase
MRPRWRSHRPRRRFAQHFLAPAWVGKVIAAIAPEAGDVFLEIGAGKGALTLPLSTTGAPMLAVEIDRDLVSALASRVPPNVTLISGDVLRLDLLPFLTGLEPQRPPGASPSAQTARRFRVVGNLPYSISSPILFRLLELQQRSGLFADATVMLQREVANRLLARAGTKAYGALTVHVQRLATVSRLLDLPPGAFSPAPKVHSSVVRLEFGPPAAHVSDAALFDRLVKGLFSQRRKTLANALKRFDRRGPAALALSRLDGRRRPETLQVTEIAKLAELLVSIRRAAML